MSPNRRMLLQTMRIAPCFSMVENKHPTPPPQPASAGFYFPVPEQKHAIPPESRWKNRRRFYKRGMPPASGGWKIYLFLTNLITLIQFTIGTILILIGAFKYLICRAGDKSAVQISLFIRIAFCELVITGRDFSHSFFKLYINFISHDARLLQ